MDTTNSPSASQPDESVDRDKKKDEHEYDKWKEPKKNKMGNDITGDIKIANSNGELEGGKDKRWHLEDDDQD